MAKPTVLYSMEDVIAQLGGTKGAAEWAGLGESAISNWLARGIPPGWHYRIDRELRQRGYEIDPGLFGVQMSPTAQRDMDRLTATS